MYKMQIERRVCRNCFKVFSPINLVEHLQQKHQVQVMEVNLDEVHSVLLQYQKRPGLQRNPFVFVESEAENVWVNSIIKCDGRYFLVEVKEQGKDISVWISVLGISLFEDNPYVAYLVQLPPDGWIYDNDTCEMKSWAGFIERTTAFTKDIPALKISQEELMKNCFKNEFYLCWNLRFVIHKEVDIRQKLMDEEPASVTACLKSIFERTSPPLPALEAQAAGQNTGLEENKASTPSTSQTTSELEFSTDEIELDTPPALVEMVMDEFAQLEIQVRNGLATPLTFHQLDLARAAFVCLTEFDKIIRLI